MDNLVVFYSQVMSSSLQVSDLHEIPCKHGFPYIDIVLTAIEIRAAHLEVESSHDANKLLSDIVCRLKCSGIDKVLVTPLGIFIVLLVCMVYIQKRQMVPINMAKSSLRLISSLLSLPRPEEAIGY